MDSRKPRSWPSFGADQSHRVIEATRRLEDVTRLISDWVWETDRDLRLTFVSERIFELLGILPAQVIGGRLSDIGKFVNSLGENVDIDIRRPFRDRPFQAIGRTGEARSFLVAAVPCFAEDRGEFIGVHGIARDVTDLKEAEVRSQRLSDAVESLSEHFALYDGEDRMVLCNERFRRLNRAVIDTVRPGVPFEDFIRAAVSRGLMPQAIGREEAWIEERLARHRGAGGSFEMERSENRWLFITEKRLPDGGTVIIGMDITDIKKAETSLRRSEQLHREFAADVAHELRTPLAALHANLDILGDEKAVVSLRRDVGDMTRIVEQLLAFTRLDVLVIGDDAVADLVSVATHVAQQIAPIALRAGHPIEVIGAEVPVLVRGDAAFLEQALRNLIENAIKYSSRDTLVTVQVRAGDNPGISVIDRGIGIPEDQREAIFERFRRADRRAGGSGLGLGIVKRIVIAHDGEINVSDNPEGGTVFTMAFPSLSN